MRISILGGGIGSPAGNCHRAALSIDRRHEIDSGIFSRNKNKNIASLKEWLPTCSENFRNIEHLAKRKNIDCLSILTPTPEHFKNINDSKNFYKNIICEKALCSSLDDAFLIKDSTKTNNLFVIYNYTGYPMVRMARKLINQNEIGNIKEIHAKMPQSSFLKKTSSISNEKNGPQAWRLIEDFIPNVDLDLGTHLHNIIEYVTGHELVSVIGHQKLSSKFKVVETCHYLFKTNKGALGSMIHGKSNMKEDNGLYFEIVGEKGTISWKQIYPEDLEISNLQGKKSLTRSNFSDSELTYYERMKPGHPAGFIEALANYYNSIDNFLSKGLEKDNVFGIESSLRGLIFFNAANESIKSKKWEYINY